MTTLISSILKSLYRRNNPKKEIGNKEQIKYPRYFIVDGDIPVKIDLDKEENEVFATNGVGSPYPPIKALVEGEEVTQKEFNRAF